MKIFTLIGVILLGSIGLVADEIEENMSYELGNKTYISYTIMGNGEECEVTYREDKELTDSTCDVSTNSKGLTIYCTKTKKICKTKNELDDFVNPSSQNDISSKISAILDDWVKAHNDNNMKLLSKLYTTELTYYGRKLTRKKCIKDKKRALKKYPNFHQSLEEIDYSKVTPNMYKVTFNKLVRLQNNGKLNVYPSYLLIDVSTSSILVEGDEITDNMKKNKKSKPLILEEKKETTKTPTKKDIATICSKVIDQNGFRNTNPYKLKGKCVKGEFKISKVVSENMALGYNLVTYIQLQSLRKSTKVGKRAVVITAEGKLSDSLVDGGEIKGLFKIVGTEKLELINGGEVTANALTWVSD